MSAAPMLEFPDNRILTHSGQYFSLSSPRVADIRIEDIAHALSRTARFTGHTYGPWPLSVAQHSLGVAENVRQQLGGHDIWRPWYACALLHDAHEAYVGDISSPMAAEIGASLVRAIKDRIQAVIHERYGLPWPVPPVWQQLIKQADLQALADEQQRYLGGDTVEGFFSTSGLSLAGPTYRRSALYVDVTLSPEMAKTLFYDWARTHTDLDI